MNDSKTDRSSRTRLWLGRLALALLMPLLLLGFAEGMLRLIGYGYPTDYLLADELHGEPVWLENSFFTYQIFSPPMARVPGPIIATQTKPADRIRIVVLGESAAQGDPLPDFGPPRVLEYTLRHRYPDQEFEVFNAAITAINSHLIQRMARELHKLQPDYVILYIGNNEVIGPFGPGTIFTRFARTDALIRLSQYVARWRVAQWIRWLGFLQSDERDGALFTGITLFMDHPVPHTDPRLASVRRRYQHNMETIIDQAEQAGAKVVLSTVAVNRSACPPSISTQREDLSHFEQVQWQASFDSGTTAVRAGDWAAAYEAFSDALTIDEEYAELNYWLGLTAQALDQTETADRFFHQALDLDAFRYRADSAVNKILRDLAARSSNIILVDADEAFRHHADWPDDQLFIDHVHFSFRGTALLARLWADALPIQHGTEHAWPTESDLRDTLMFTEVAELSVINEMRSRFQRAPFDRQIDIETRIQALAARAAVINENLRAHEPHTLPSTFRARVEQFPTDLYFPLHWSNYLISMSRFSEAWPVALAIHERHPHRRGPRSHLALMLAHRGESAESAEMLLGDRGRQGYFTVMGARFLARSLVGSGYHEEAVAGLEALREVIRPADFSWIIDQEITQARSLRDGLQTARHLVASGRWADAGRELEGILDRHPRSGDAVYLLGVVDRQLGEPARGFQTASHGLRMMRFARAHYHAGLWQARSRNIEGAQDLFDTATALAFDDHWLVNSLAWIYAAHSNPQLRQPERAEKLMSDLLERTGNPSATLLDTYAAALAANQRFEEAIVFATEAAERAEREGQQQLYYDITARMRQYRAREAAYWSASNRPLNYW